MRANIDETFWDSPAFLVQGTNYTNSILIYNQVCRMLTSQHKFHMKIELITLCLVLLLIEIQGATTYLHAGIPPRGWNSYDSFSWTIDEKDFLENAKLVSSKLRQYGYQYVVVDYLWYRKFEPGAYTNSLGFDVIDEWGRLIPDPKRWPSSREGNGFKIIADAVHRMGLKFGIHVMRGISTQAYSANTPVLGSNGLPYQEGGKIWRARDIALPKNTCKWMDQGFMSVNMRLGASKAFLRSLYEQYAEWGVDFVKHDCVFGEDLNIDEIVTVSEILKEANRPILYSISPGTNVTVDMAAKVHPFVNMYRVTADDWDIWKDVESHFNIARELASHGLIGARGLLGKSWPDLDMLPFGHLSSVGANQGPYRISNLSFEEQRSQMTLWAMAKSPLMFGGDPRTIDDQTLKLITHPTVLYINAYSTSNIAFPHVRSIPLHQKYQKREHKEGSKAYAWIAKNPQNGETYLAFFNSDDIPAMLYARMSDVFHVTGKKSYGFAEKNHNIKYVQPKQHCICLEVWSGRPKEIVNGIIYIKLPIHGCALFVIRCT